MTGPPAPRADARPAGVAKTPPRPISSYALVAVSGVALALTGQVAVPVLALHAALVACAFGLRRRPRAWQQSGWLLNPALAGVIAVATGVWLRGALPIVALAHFAHLAQALQLLDARPRRSDFLLVALSLFQMILAANLTDSFWFPPLLALFVLAMVWTLIVHTLWSETLAAGETWSPERALAPGFARTAFGASALSLVLALGIFLVLPRVRTGALAAPGLLAMPAAGFSDRVALGDLGRIRQDPTLALRVETLRGAPPPAEDAYWRGLAFDHFDGRHWSVTPPRRAVVASVSDLGVRTGTAARSDDLVQRVVREPATAGVLFAAGSPSRIEGSLGRIEADPNGGYYAPDSAEERVQYVVATPTPPRTSELRGDRAEPPGQAGERYLALPPLAPEVRALAERITAGEEADADRIAAIEAHLRRHGRYSDRPPPERPGDPRSPIETFLLGELAGHCEYFASAMVVLARSLGLPARLVNGFAGGRENALGGFVEVTRSDAHAWVEVHYAEHGWVRYDPTPPDLRLRGAAAGWLAQLRSIGSAAEHWWYSHVVEFDRSDQMRALRAGWLAWQRWRASPEHAAPARPARPRRELELGRVLPLGVALVAIGGGGLLLARRRRTRLHRGERLPAAYAEALGLLERHRALVRGASTPAREFARRAARDVPPVAAAAFWALTEAYLAERFGGRRVPASRAALRTLRDTLRPR